MYKHTVGTKKPDMWAAADFPTNITQHAASAEGTKDASVPHCCAVAAGALCGMLQALQSIMFDAQKKLCNPLSNCSDYEIKVSEK